MLSVSTEIQSMGVDFGCPSTIGKKVVSRDDFPAVVVPDVILSLECETGCAIVEGSY